MHSSIIQMQRCLTELDRHIVSGDMEGFEMSLNQIRKLCDHLENTFKEDVEHHKRTQERFRSKYKYEYVNEVNFLVKTVSVSNAFTDDYLENFVMVRTNQLEGAGAMDRHNEFWLDYTVIHGNVYGSVPLELLSKESGAKLKTYGWKETPVKVYDFGNQLEMTMAFYEFCDLEFGHYILVKESETGSYMMLQYLLS